MSANSITATSVEETAVTPGLELTGSVAAILVIAVADQKRKGRIKVDLITIGFVRSSWN